MSHFHPYTPIVIARATDPDTSHAAAKEFNADKAKKSNSVKTVIAILAEHGTLTDFQIRALWPTYWGPHFSDSLPCKARHWARLAGEVRHVGYSTHQGRKVRTWEIGKEKDLPQTSKSGLKQRIKELEIALEKIRALYGNEKNICTEIASAALEKPYG
jgi:hypothetical protein